MTLSKSGKRSLFLLAIFVFSVTFTIPVHSSEAQSANTGPDASELNFQYTSSRISTLGQIVDIKTTQDSNSGNWQVDPELPEGVSLFSVGAIVDGRVIDSFDNTLCHITSSMSVMCWTSHPEDGTPVVSNLSLSDESFETVSVVELLPTSISLGKRHICSIIESWNGSDIYCWGSNTFGQLGIGEGVFSEYPQPIESDTEGRNWTQVASGSVHSCGVLEDREVYCWGANTLGQLGSGVPFDGLGISRVIGLPEGEVKQIEAGHFHTCATFSTNQVFCWGWNGYGQLGAGDFSVRNTATQVPLNTSPESRILLHAFGSCVTQISDSNFCWGLDNSNENGKSDIGSFVNSPISISDSMKILLAGDNHLCFLNYSSNKFCSGGLPSDFDKSIGIKSSTSGNAFNCIVDSNGKIYCDGVFSNSVFQQDTTNYPMLHNIPSVISTGQIRGTPISNSEGHYMVSAISQFYESSEEIYLYVNYDLDPDSDFWESSVEDSCGSDKLDPLSYPLDSDSDGICDRIDQDDDNDGFSDYNDQFPLNPKEWLDSDYDGIGSNSEIVEITVPMKGALSSVVILGTILCLQIMEAFNQRKRDFVSTNKKLSIDEPEEMLDE